MHTTDGKGICRSSWRKCVRCPRRLRVPSLNKIAQTVVRPSPLWGFRAANCFRDFIVAWQNENLRWSGLSYLSRITGTRRSVAKGFCVSAFCPLECKGIRSVSLRWRSFRNLRWSQLLTSVHNQISPHYFPFDMTNDCLFEMRICTCMIKPFGSLQVVIRLGEWQAAGSRIKQA